MMRGFCPMGLCPEGAYVLMELFMEGVLSGGGFVPDSEKIASFVLISLFEYNVII